MESHDQETYKAYTDGGSRGNPGPAAYGFVVYDPNGNIVAESKETLGVTTNNQAEYQGLVAVLRHLKLMNIPPTNKIVCYSDSQLMVRQVNGDYKMKSEELRPWLNEIQALRQELSAPVRFIDIRREQNKYADGLVNQALDGVTHG